MKQLHVFHATRGNGIPKSAARFPGHNETWVGPLTPREAKMLKAEHYLMDKMLRMKGDGPKACIARIETYLISQMEGVERIPVCNSLCLGCRDGSHNEVRDAELIATA